MSDNRHTLFGADGRYESTNRMPEPKLPGDRIEGPEGTLIWDGHVWVSDEDRRRLHDRWRRSQALTDDEILAGLMRRLLTSDGTYVHAGKWLIIDGALDPITDEECAVVQKLRP